MPEKIKVILKRVFVKSDADWFGSGLPVAKWSAVVDVANKTKVTERRSSRDWSWPKS